MIVEFFTNFLANALSDLLIGIVLVFLINKYIAEWSSPKLSIKAQGLRRKSSSFFVPHHVLVHNFPPTKDKPSFVDFQIEIDNTGKRAAVNWMLVITFSDCTKEDNSPLFLLDVPGDGNAEVKYWKNSPYDFSRFIYTGEQSQIIHSGLYGFSPKGLQIRINLFDEFQSALETNQKLGYYSLYADNMKPQEGFVVFTLDIDKPNRPKASLGFFRKMENKTYKGKSYTWLSEKS